MLSREAKSQAPAFSIIFRFKFTDSSIHLCNCLFASLESILFCFIKTVLSILSLSLQKFFISLKTHCNLLFSSEFISQARSIHHCFLSLIFGHCSFCSHFIQIMAQCVHLLFTLRFGTTDCLVLTRLVRKCFIGIASSCSMMRLFLSACS